MGFVDRIRFALFLLRDSTQRKHLFRWLNSYNKGYLLQKRIPWFVFDAKDFLDSLQLENKQVFEYGSGGSTLYWLSRNMKCISVEHDSIWYEAVHNLIGSSTDVDHRLTQAEKLNRTTPYDSSNPMLYSSADPTFHGYCFKKYVTQIDSFPQDYFDIVLIDGRARPACIMHCVTKIKIDGLLILDNSDRDYYLKRTLSLLRNFERKTFKGATPGASWLTETSVFIRKT